MPQPIVIQPKLSNTEFNSLHDFYNATNGPFWRWHNVSIHSVPWNFSIPDVNPCKANWQGLFCSCGLISCSVSQIFLDHHNLTGHLPDSMKNFELMNSLILRGNNITGTITASIGNMTDLEELDLSYNSFYGEIPSSIGRLWKLKTLNLGMNKLTKIPETLYDLSNLEGLDIVLNKMSSSISPRLGNLTKLRTLQYQGSGFTGKIPDTIGNLRSLETLDLSANNITSSLPDGFYKLHNLTSCIISSTFLTGTFSPDIGGMTKLRTFEFTYNLVRGLIPPEIGNLINLDTLMLNNNLFTSSLPPSLVKLTNLKLLFLSSNLLTGKVDFLCGMNLTLLDLNGNKFSGSFPMSSVLFHYLVFMDISVNHLTGPVPWREDIDGPLIIWYEIYSNYFTGTLPEITEAPHLRYYLVQENLLSGTLPAYFLASSTGLYYLAMSQNYLSGTIPESLGQFRQLNQLDMNGNMFHGSIPESFGHLRGLVVLDLDENLLSGPIPANITRLSFLQELMLQNNFLTGSLDILLNSTNLRFIANIDVSGNLFTGTLSPQFFINSVQLTSFAAGSNCLKGKIPETICETKTITSLTLDGLTTAENCRQYLFSGLSSQFNGFIVNRYLGSSIPTCLFEMPEIELLHLSGNGIFGTIPATIIISPTLSDLSLSYNALEGTIPDVIQNRNWYSLDLSYNKLSGTLYDGLSSNTLYLEVNRLSGEIPQKVVRASDVSILEGNIFQCDTFETDLPTNDPDYNKYSCGSDSANDVLYAWLGVLLIVPLLVLVVWRVGYGLRVSMGAVLKQMAIWRNALKSDDPKKINLLRLSIYLHEVRKTVIVISLYAIVVLIPIYVSLTLTSPSYTYQYAWSISAMLVKGETAAIALFISLFVVVLLFFTLIQRVLANIDRKAPKCVEYDGRSSSVSSLRSERTLEKDKPWFIKGLTYMVVSLLNVLVMGVSDFTYVYILLNYSTVVVSLSALALALFRLGTNNFLLWSALPLTSKCLSWIREKASCRFSNDQECPFRISATRYTTKDIHFLENLILFNNIIIPGLAIIFTLPDCFFNALFAADSVSSSYSYKSCEQYIAPIGRGHICHTRERTIYYVPPYIYSFQCSSKIVINYVVVYVLMFILSGQVIPIGRLSLKLLYEKLKEEDEKVDENPSLSLQSSSQGTSSLSQSPSSITKKKSWNNVRARLRRIIKRGLNQYFKDFRLKPEENEMNEESLNKSRNRITLSSMMTSFYQSKKNKRNKPIFSKLSLTVQINSYLTIMMCFGVLFPPLAVIAAISICSVTYFEELCIGWVLTETRRLGPGYEWYEEQLERECGGVEESSNLTIWSTLVVSCGLYGYMIFDTMGDELGWVAALPITLLMVLMPLIFVLGFKFGIPFLSSPVVNTSHQTTPSRNDGERDETVEVRTSRAKMIRDDNSIIELISGDIVHSSNKSEKYVIQNPLI